MGEGYIYIFTTALEKNNLMSYFKCNCSGNDQKCLLHYPVLVSWRGQEAGRGVLIMIQEAGRGVLILVLRALGLALRNILHKHKLRLPLNLIKTNINPKINSDHNWFCYLGFLFVDCF